MDEEYDPKNCIEMHRVSHGHPSEKKALDEIKERVRQQILDAIEALTNPNEEFPIAVVLGAIRRPEGSKRHDTQIIFAGDAKAALEELMPEIMTQALKLMDAMSKIEKQVDEQHDKTMVGDKMKFKLQRTDTDELEFSPITQRPH